MDVWLILLVGGLIFFGVLVVLLIFYSGGLMQRLPPWTGLRYSQDFKPELKGYEKVQIAGEALDPHAKMQTFTYEIQPGKTLWDWLQLLLVPVVLAIVAFAFNAGQASINQQIQDQSKQEQVINDYLNQMSTILLQSKLHSSQPGDPIRALAQASTLAALGRLDSAHKNIIVLFLYRADILKYHYYKHKEMECGDPKVLKKQFTDENPIITLSQGHLEGVTINDLGLSCIDLHNVYLQGSNFSASVLDRADLGLSFATNADFSNTSMNSANLYYLDLEDANLQGAKLQSANMNGICLSHARLNGADLQHADLRAYHHHSVNRPPIQFCGQHDNAADTPANLSNADLTGTKLMQADFTQANLTDAILAGADLTGADLRGADLSGANLDKTVLKGTRYNTKEILVKDSQGNILIKVLPTTWPQGFNPKAAGATEMNTLSGANLSGANLSGASLLRGDLRGTTLTGATLTGATLWGGDLRGTNLSGATLTGATLWGVDLSGANLSNAKITQAQLNEAISLKKAIMPDGKTHT